MRAMWVQDRVSAWEEAVLQSCKARAIRDFTVGACVSSAIVWSGICSLISYLFPCLNIIIIIIIIYCILINVCCFVFKQTYNVNLDCHHIYD